MDRRLNGYVDEHNDGSMLVLRNAGANVRGLLESINSILNEKNIKSIEVLTHTDCGAMKVAFSSLHDGEKVSDAVSANLVKQFSNNDFTSREELEKINEKMQEEAVRKIAEERGVQYKSELLDIPKTDLHNDEHGQGHKLFVMKPTHKKYAEVIKGNLSNAYIVEAMKIDEVVSDIEIAVKSLGIKDIIFVAEGASEYRQVSTDANRLSMEPFMKVANISSLKL